MILSSKFVTEFAELRLDVKVGGNGPLNDQQRQFLVNKLKQFPKFYWYFQYVNTEDICHYLATLHLAPSYQHFDCSEESPSLPLYAVFIVG